MLKSCTFSFTWVSALEANCTSAVAFELDLPIKRLFLILYAIAQDFLINIARGHFFMKLNEPMGSALRKNRRVMPARNIF